MPEEGGSAVGTLGTAVTTALGQVLDWMGEVINSLVTEGSELNPLLAMFAVGIAISAVMLGIRIVRSLVWGA